MPQHKLIRALIIKLALVCSSAHGVPLVITSIKPLYNLTAAISDGVFTPLLLAEDNVSEHDFQLKPSQMKQLHNADLIFWIGPALEVNLNKPLSNIRAGKASRMIGLAGIKLLPNRNLVDYDAEHNHAHHDHGVYDPHIWLSTDNAIIMSNYITNKLIVVDPKHKAQYEQNLANFKTKLKQHIPLWHEKLHAINNVPIVVMHDAYQYFHKLNIVGTIVVDHDIPSSIKHIRQIKQVLLEQNVKCICSEPQLNALIAKTLTEDHKIKHVVVDPLGANEDLGPNGYIALIDKLTASFYSCQP